MKNPIVPPFGANSHMPSPYPRYVEIDSRPVKLIDLPDGTEVAMVVDLTTGELVADPTYLTRSGRTLNASEYEQAVAKLQIAAIVELLPTIRSGDESEIRRRVAPLIATLHLDQKNPHRGAASIEGLLASMPDLAKAGIDTAKLSAGLQVIVDWLEHPTADSHAKLIELAKNLGWDPVAEQALEEAARSAEIKADVKTSLDEIFGKLDLKF